MEIRMYSKKKNYRRVMGLTVLERLQLGDQLFAGSHVEWSGILPRHA
jgi:hypothetical protein